MNQKKPKLHLIIPSPEKPNTTINMISTAMSIPPGTYLPPAIVSPSRAPTSDFIDYYSVLGLDIWATSEEIKAKHRKLRADYFTNSPVKYRPLQEAYLVLVDSEARLQYDTVYRQRIGMPPPPPFQLKADEASATTPGDQSSAVRTMAHGIESQLACKSHVSPPRNVAEEAEVQPVEHVPFPEEEVVDMTESPTDEEDRISSYHGDDLNWALKHFNPIYEPIIGTEEYWSFIPLPHAFTKNGKAKKMPMYTGSLATMARPY
ncbi:unnamed protein product [Periconia digitata]|uniref:J domain-containing protein n=1 Tax=Periconia digitata TaxID=1303443 RepID=A0A9W4USH8_9PLEO|nr:unnamed protein product [Periconia digitata]